MRVVDSNIRRDAEMLQALPIQGGHDMKTLQDVLDAVGAHPERYGTHDWYRDGQPWCPLAVEVLGMEDVDSNHDSHLHKIRTAAAALGCTEADIQHFTTWWDCATEDFLGGIDGFCRSALEERGYRVPPDEVRTRAGSDVRFFT